MRKIKFTDEECTDIDNAVGTLRIMSGYMQEELCRREDERIIKYGRETLDDHVEDIKRDIDNLKKIFNKGCEFEPAEVGLAALFGEGKARAKN